MTLKPIQGAPIGAPIPDFPTGEPGPLVVPASRFTRRPVEPLPLSLPPPSPSPVRRPGPVEIRGSDDSTLTFRSIPEIPAINRSSMTISITGESTGDYSPRMMPQLDLATDEAKAFLLALRDEDSPIVIADSRSGFQVEFAIAEDGPTLTVSKPGQAGRFGSAFPLTNQLWRPGCLPIQAVERIGGRGSQMSAISGETGSLWHALASDAGPPA